tara:strand:- start:79 stop:474 length:396 start_codon:yes stop_codon:yes gene_type:complete
MIIPNNNQGDETQFLCDVCSEPVTNPICPFCLTEEIEAWLTFYPGLRKALLPKIHKYLDKISNKITAYGTICIKCKDNSAHVCPYCFTAFVFYELKKLHAEKFILKEYFEFFNFDLHHTGYTEEAEELGVI